MKNIIQRIMLAKNGPTAPYPLNGGSYYPGLQTVILVQIAENNSYTIHRILPLSSPLSPNVTHVYRGKNYQICSNKQCLTKIALRFCGLRTEDPDDYSTTIKEEDFNLWKTNPCVKAILVNQQMNHPPSA